MQNYNEKQDLDGFNTNKNLENYTTPYSSFIGAWFIDKKVCNELIRFFDLNTDLAKPGGINNFTTLVNAAGNTFIQEGTTINTEVKDSLDLKFNTKDPSPLPGCKVIGKMDPEWGPFNPLNIYLSHLHEVLFLYLERYRYANYVNRFDAGTFNIQRYQPGGGFKKWHCERDSRDNSNHLVFMTYLNDVPEGGTEFLYQDLKLPAQKGLTVIWPSDWTHTHKGVISKEHEKYIMTGWYNYI